VTPGVVAIASAYFATRDGVDPDAASVRCPDAPHVLRHTYITLP
jgi:hypothetical protein